MTPEEYAVLKAGDIVKFDTVFEGTFIIGPLQTGRGTDSLWLGNYRLSSLAAAELTLIERAQ